MKIVYKALLMDDGEIAQKKKDSLLSLFAINIRRDDLEGMGRNSMKFLEGKDRGGEIIWESREK